MEFDEQSATEELGLRTAKAASFQVSGRFIALVISAAMFIIVARVLGPHNYGIYVLIMAAVGFISTLGSPNIGPFLKERVPRLMAKKKHVEVGIVLGDGVLLAALVGMVLFVISIALGNQISEYFLNTGTSLYIVALDIGLLAVLFNLLYITFNDALISIGRSESAAGAAVVHSIIQALTSTYLVLSGYGLYGALVGYSTGLVVTLILELYLINRRHRIRFQLAGIVARMKETINFAKHLTLSGIISTLLMYFSVIYLGFFELPATIGFYGIAQKAGSSLDTFGSSIGLVLIPMFSEAFVRKKSGIRTEKLFYYSVYFSLVFATPVIMLVVLFAQPLILLFFTSAYLGSTIYMQLVVLSLLVSVIATFGPNFLIGKGKPQKVLKYAIVAGVVELVAMIALTYYFQVVGMIAAVFYIGNFVLALLYINYIWKTDSVEAKIRLTKVLRVIIANLIVTGIVAAILFAVPVLFGTLSYPVAIILGVVMYVLLYPAAAAMLRAIGHTDIKILRAASNSLPVFGLILRGVLDYTSHFVA